MRRIRFLYCALVTSAMMTSGCSTPEDPLVSQVRDLTTRWMESRAVPGVAVGVVRPDASVLVRTFGVASLNDSTHALTERSMFHVASNSKPFVATAVLQLAERGELDLDLPVVTDLEYFRMADDRYRFVTIRQLLNHTSGLPDVEDYGWDEHEIDDGALERYVRSLADTPLRADPGAEFAYSNMGYEVLGDVIAKVSGLSFETYMKRNILDPTNMLESSFLLPDVNPGLLTDPHVWEFHPKVAPVRPYTRSHAPSSTLYSNILEMTRWARLHLANGTLDGRTIVGREAHATMWADTTVTGWSGYDTAVGLGWFVGEHRGHRVVSHRGRDPGYGSLLLLLPDEESAVVVLANADFAPISQIGEGILDLLLGITPAEPQTTARYVLGPILAREGIDAMVRAFHRIRKDAARQVDLGEDAIQSFAIEVYRTRGAEEALEIFRLSAHAHPESWRALDGVGGMLLVLDRPHEALEAYRKSLALNPNNTNAQRMVARIEGEER